MTNVVSYLIWDASMQLKVIYRLTICFIWYQYSRQRIARAEFAVKATDFTEGTEGQIRTIPFLDPVPFFSLKSSMEILRLQIIQVLAAITLSSCLLDLQ